MLAVPNAALMDDHQRELAEALGAEAYVAVGDPRCVAARLTQRPCRAAARDGCAHVPRVPGAGAGRAARAAPGELVGSFDTHLHVLRMDDAKAGAGKASLSVPFLRSFRSRSSSAAPPPAGAGKVADTAAPAATLGDIHRAIDALLQTKPGTTGEALPHLRFLVDALQQSTEKGGALLDAATATPLVSSLTVLCSRLMRPQHTLDVRVGVCEVLAATLRYAEASTASTDTSTYEARTLTGWDATVPTQVLSSLDRALLFKLVVALRDPHDWDAAQLRSDPARALCTLSVQISALQALSRDGRDVLAFRTILDVLTEWITPLWACMLYLRAHAPSQGDAAGVRATSEQCAHALLLLLAAVIKFHASRISAQRLDAALRCVADLVLRPQRLDDAAPADAPVDVPEPPPPLPPSEPLLYGYSHYGLEALSPYFSTPRPLQPRAGPTSGPARARARDGARREASAEPPVALEDDAAMPALTDADIHAGVKVLDAAVCFAYLPAPCIVPVVYALCRISGLAVVHAEGAALLDALHRYTGGVQDELWSVLGNLLRSHGAYSVLRVLCQLLWSADEEEPKARGPAPQPSVLVGALLFLHAAFVWGAEDRAAYAVPRGARAKAEEGALSLLSLPVVASIVRGAIAKNVPVLDLAVVLFLDDYLPERRVDVGASVDALLEQRRRVAPVPLCTLNRESDVQAEWDLLLDLPELAQRHMAVWHAAQESGAARAPDAAVSGMVLHVLVDLLSGTPAGAAPGASAPLWERPVAAMPHVSSLFWALAPLLPDYVMVEMMQQNRVQHAYVPSSSHWLENMVELVNTIFPPAGRGAALWPGTSMASFEVVQLVSATYDAVQDMPAFRNELIEQVVVPLVERALDHAPPSVEVEAMLRTMLRHAATVSALDASIAGGQPFFRLLRVLVRTIERAEGAEATVERKQARAQHSRQLSLGPSNVSTVREAQAGIQRAIRSVRDMATIFYQLSFAQPNAAVMLPYDVSASPDVHRRAQTCSLAIFRDVLQLVQCNASFHLVGGGEASSGAPYTMHVPTEVRLVLLQWLMRLRADRHHQIYFVHDVDALVEPLAQLVQRTDAPAPSDERRGRDERPVAAGEARGRSRVRDAPSTERGRSQRRVDERRREPSASRAPDTSRAPEPRVLWRVPEAVAVDLPDEAWPSMLWKVYAHEHVGDELPEREPEEGQPLVLPTSEYLGVLIGLLQSEADWDVVSYIITHLPAQLSNKHCFCGPHTREQIAALCDLLCTLLLQQKQFPNLLLPDDVKRTDMYAVLYATLTVLISYRRLLSRTQHDALVDALITGLTKSQTTAQPCVRALVVACHELQKSFTRLVPALLMKLSTIMSSMTASVHILELLVEMSRTPATYANFTESDYKRVFGIALQYIQYHHSSAASSREAIRSSPARFSLSQYVMMLAYSNIQQWFITLRLGERAKHVPHITRGLMLANEGRERLTDQTSVCLDFLARFTYSNAQSKPTRSLIRFLVSHAEPNVPRRPPPAASESQTWLIGKSLVTITSLKRKGWFEMNVRRPSGSASIVAKLENEPSTTLIDEERMAAVLPTTLTRTHKGSALALPARLAPSPLTHPEFYLNKHSEERRQFASALGPPPEPAPPEHTAASPQPETASSARSSPQSSPPNAETSQDERLAPAPPAAALSTSPTTAARDAPASYAPATGERAADADSAAAASATRKRDDAISAYIALQLSAYPDMVVDQAPQRLPAEPATDRLLRAIDLTPVYDFHKIGVLYAGFNQCSEKEILSNTYGSPAYMKFLSRLGDLIPLRGQEDVYTGGLDRQQDEHGKYAYIWKDHIKQIVFHTATLMPNRDSDPNHAAKKALIGNDWVHIIFNEANRPYEFGTIASQFNFCNIVISPHSVLKNGVEAYEVDDSMFCTSPHSHRPCGAPAPPGAARLLRGGPREARLVRGAAALRAEPSDALRPHEPDLPGHGRVDGAVHKQYVFRARPLLTQTGSPDSTTSSASARSSRRARRRRSSTSPTRIQ